ncbi:dual specificity protein phosphatase 13B-like isoform X1 [Lissotriton helveticus]
MGRQQSYRKSCRQRKHVYEGYSRTQRNKARSNVERSQRNRRSINMSCSRQYVSPAAGSCSSCRSSSSSRCAPTTTCQKKGKTPSACDLLELMERANDGQPNQEDEVFPNLFLGNAYAAMDRENLTCLGITHVLNAAHDTGEVITNACYYKGMPITYKGFQIFDDPDFKISCFFCPAAKFIDEALRCPKGKILVHCCVTGISRGATIVLAYLMLYKNMSLKEAVCKLSSKRYIRPNDGFLEELRTLDKEK